MKSRSLSLVLAATAAWSAACGSSTSTTASQLNLDGPTDVAFACYGALRITGGGRAGTAADPVTSSAAPLALCDAYAEFKTDVNPSALPLGQEVLPDPDGTGPLTETTLSVDYYAFVLQTEPGTIALAKFPTRKPNGPVAADCTILDDVTTGCITGWTCELPDPQPDPQVPGTTYYGKCKLPANTSSPPVVAPGDAVVLDLDPLTPGANGVSVGALPVALAMDASGCYALTANAGSCDLSVVDVASVASFRPEPIVNRLEVTSAGGDPITARPAAMLAAPIGAPVGVACPAAPTGLVWIAYPDCHLVAAVDPSTGAVKAGVAFAADGTATITTGAVSCPAQCGGDGALTDGFRPTTLDLATDTRVDTRRLAIGGGGSRITVVDLDAGFLPTGVEQVTLSGGVEVADVAITPQIGMGGQAGEVFDDGTVGGQAQFVYAVASDGTVRVADVLDVDAECDTQVDPRALRGETDVTRLSCLPVGDLTTPPRRATAVGPGIQLPSRGKPTAVTIVHAVPANIYNVTPSPSALIGWFAVITATTGEVYLANIDDDNYPDLEDQTSPVAVTLPLALPHGLRDNVDARGAVAERLDSNNIAQPVCLTASQDTSQATENVTGGPHMVVVRDGSALVEQALGNARIATVKAGSLPALRRVFCDGADTEEAPNPIGPVGVFETQFAAPVELRETVFPDLRTMAFDEVWTATWEGRLSNDGSGAVIDGPSTRSGLTMVDGTGMRIVEPGGPYCAAGVEPFDVVSLAGCNPANNNLDCDVGHTCYAHPDSASGVGACFPSGQVEALASACRDFLVSDRTYAATAVTSGELRLTGRRVVLRTTPLDGCTSAAQCDELETVEARLTSATDPGTDTTVPTTPHAWACEADPSRAPGIDRCVMSCTTEADCSTGAVCEAGRCVQGVVPPLQCALGIQRYDLRASEAFTVIGSRTGYQHPWIVGPGDACVRNAAAPRDLIGRIPLRVPPCTAAPDSPNPCAEETTTFERTRVFEAGTCKPVTTAPFAERTTSSIRFTNPQMDFHLIDLTYPGDATCIGDRGGSLVNVPVVFPGYAITFRIQGGFLAKRLALSQPLASPANVVTGPFQSIWVVDQGDLITSQGSTRGAVYRAEATALTTTSTLR